MGSPFVIFASPGGRRGRRSEQPGKPGEKPSFRQRIDALRYVPRLLAMVWDTHRGFTVAMAVLRLLRAFIPIITLWIGKLIIDCVVFARSNGGQLRSGLLALSDDTLNC